MSMFPAGLLMVEKSNCRQNDWIMISVAACEHPEVHRLRAATTLGRSTFSGRRVDSGRRRFLGGHSAFRATLVGRLAAARAGRSPGNAASVRPAKIGLHARKNRPSLLISESAGVGFATELWTAKRLAHLIRQTWQISFNPR